MIFLKSFAFLCRRHRRLVEKCFSSSDDDGVGGDVATWFVLILRNVRYAALGWASSHIFDTMTEATTQFEFIFCNFECNCLFILILLHTCLRRIRKASYEQSEHQQHTLQFSICCFVMSREIVYDRAIIGILDCELLWMEFQGRSRWRWRRSCYKTNAIICLMKRERKSNRFQWISEVFFFSQFRPPPPYGIIKHKTLDPMCGCLLWIFFSSPVCSNNNSSICNDWR